LVWVHSFVCLESGFNTWKDKKAGVQRFYFPFSLDSQAQTDSTSAGHVQQ
jgi:hypothetical protein